MKANMAKKCGYSQNLMFIAVLLIVALLGACDPWPQTSSKKTALLYGVTIYRPLVSQGTSPNLAWPVNDVDGMESMLGGFGWDVTARRDSQASKSQLAADIANLASTVQSGERILFYWSGHGGEISRPGQGLDCWILPYGSYNPANFSFDLVWDEMINTSELAELFRPLQEKNVNLIFILDSCNSGGFVNNQTYVSPLPDNFSQNPDLGEPLNDKTLLFDSLSHYFSGPAGNSTQQPNVWVFASSGPSEEAWENQDYEHGVVTNWILRAGQNTNGKLNADANFDNRITIQELFAFATAGNEFWNEQTANLLANDYQYYPHLSGNSLDIVLFSKP